MSNKFKKVIALKLVFMRFLTKQLPTSDKMNVLMSHKFQKSICFKVGIYNASYKTTFDE